MNDDSQLLIPASFILLYQAQNGRLTAARQELAARYELCEDMACTLVEHAQQLYHGGASSEEGVLAGVHAALCAQGSALSPAEARWVTLRLGELLAWRSPLLP